MDKPQVPAGNGKTSEPGEGHPKADHERGDISYAGVAKFIVGLGMLFVVTLLSLWGLLEFFRYQQRRAEPPPPRMAITEAERIPPEPRLQGAPGSKHQLASADLDMKDLRSESDRVLDSYGWVDKNAGVVRIPIEEAMRLVVQRGLPQGPQAGQKDEGIEVPTVSSSGRVEEERKE
ncbi:MAG TPA: hypothetical protein VJX67_06465 [Blastocatellia bacterium]|nr:hypothetical protein [Blastocatellia bacterium]